MITIFIHGNIISIYTLAFKILAVIPKVSDLNFVKKILTLHVSSFLESAKVYSNIEMQGSKIKKKHSKEASVDLGNG